MENYENGMGQQMYQNREVEEPMSVGGWFITLLLLAIPCINIIMMLVWGFGAGNKSRRNFCRAYMIWVVIAIVVVFILTTIVGIGTVKTFDDIQKSIY